MSMLLVCSYAHFCMLADLCLYYQIHTRPYCYPCLYLHLHSSSVIGLLGDSITQYLNMKSGIKVLGFKFQLGLLLAV